MDPDVLLVGCGDLGSRIGLQLVGLGHRVLALRRRADLVPPPVQGLSVDLTREVPDLPALQLRHLVVALTARPRTEDAYRATYVDGMRRALDALDAAGARPTRAVLVSSTGVHGDVPDGTLVDEGVPPAPADGAARVLLEAEQLFTARVPGATVLRCSGLYGGDASRLLERVRSGEVGDPHRWTNRIHRDDAAGAIRHVLGLDDPAEVYVGVDTDPAERCEVLTWLADRLGVPRPARGEPGSGSGRGNKRVDSSRLQASGYRFRYPTFREGYAEMIDAMG